jgi:ATP/maltotriose-dependent transcriptional regulator MalT
MHRSVKIKILGAGGTDIASTVVDAEKLPELERHLSDFAEHNPGLAQEEIIYIILFKSEQDKNRLLSAFEKETGLHIVRSNREHEPYEPLTFREEEVLELLSRGLSYKLIAGALNVSMSTVCTHILHIYRKLHAHNRTEAVAAWKRKYPN